MTKVLSSAFFLLTFICQAQIGYEKGYFINNKGITVNCLIKNLDWRDNPKSFNYKLSQDDTDVKTESLATVSEFGIENFSKFKRFTVNIEYSSNDVKTMTTAKNPEWKLETLFLEELVSGEATLYMYSNKNFTKYFYETKSAPVEQLVRIKYLTEGIFIQENNFYKQQLFNNVRCEKTPDKDFNKISYEKSDLVRHFMKFNSCSETPTKDLTSGVYRESYSLKVFTGVYQADLSITDPNIFYNVGTDLSKTIVKVGIEGEYILPFYKNKLSLFVAPSYQKFSTSKSYDKSDGNIVPATIHNTVTIDYASVEIPIGVRYYFFLNKKSKIYLNAALVLDIPTSSSIKFENSNNAFNAKHAFEIATTSSFAVGVGYTYKKFSAELRMYTPKELLDQEVNWSAEYQATGLNIAYKFL